MAYCAQAHSIHNSQVLFRHATRTSDLYDTSVATRAEARRGEARVLEADVRPMYLEANRTPSDLRPWVRQAALLAPPSEASIPEGCARQKHVHRRRLLLPLLHALLLLLLLLLRLLQQLLLRQRSPQLSGRCRLLPSAVRTM